MNTEENDPDTLQILDELDEKWVRLWRKATSKEATQAIELTTIVFSPEETHATVRANKHASPK